MIQHDLFRIRFVLPLILYPLSFIAIGGCLNIKAPDNFEMKAPEIHVGSSASDTPANVPETHSEVEAKAELRKAYARIESLEKDNRKLKDKISKMEKDRKEERALAKRNKSARDDAADPDRAQRTEFP